MFSTEVTGKLIKTVEMSDGFVLHIRPFGKGDLNLAIVGIQSMLLNPLVKDRDDGARPRLEGLGSKELDTEALRLEGILHTRRR